MTTIERKEQEKEARRTTILGVAEKLFSTKGYDGVTMDNVALEAKLAKGTLYLYFQNKETLYLAVVTQGTSLMGEMVEKAMALEKKGISKTYAGGLAYYEFSKKYPFYFHMMIDARQRYLSGTADEVTRSELARKQQHIWQITADAVRTGIADGTIKPYAEPRKTATLLIETTTTMIRSSHEVPATMGGSPAMRDEIVYFTLDMLRHSMENKSTPVKGV